MGTGDKLKSQALEVITQVTAGNPVIQSIYSRPIGNGSLLDSVVDSHPAIP
jgi:hypothetical protein